MPRNLITAQQAAQRLGVKPQTIYAYVSRGLLSRTLAADGRTSRFNASEVERLALRGRPRKAAQRVGTVDVSLVTAITSIEPQRLSYRGYDATALASNSSFEAVAELLWSGQLPAGEVRWPEAGFAQSRMGARGRDDHAEGAAALRFAVATALLGSRDPLRFDLRPAAVIGNARRLLVAWVDALPVLGRSRAPVGSASIAAHLWPRVSPLPPTRAHVRLLDAALILLADHELASSTLAARVAASTRADPYAIALAGLGAVAGVLHGRAALRVHQLLLAAAVHASPELVVGQALATGPLPGFGHPVYSAEDPRARDLLARLQPLLKPSRLTRLERVLKAARAGGHAAPLNVDFALGALAQGMDMPLGATEAIFALARCAGWIAHALEEYEEAPLRFRGRALYDGPRTS